MIVLEDGKFKIVSDTDDEPDDNDNDEGYLYPYIS